MKPVPDILPYLPFSSFIHLFVLEKKGGRTIFCSKPTWTNPNFPKHLFYKGESKRNRVIAHTKMIIAIKHFDPLKDDERTFKYEGWLYIGSHNL